LAGFGGVELVFDGRQDLEPQLPGQDDPLGAAMAAERDGLGADAAALELRSDLGQFGPGAGKDSGWSRT
jgi:hypothetical protein